MVKELKKDTVRRRFAESVTDAWPVGSWPRLALARAQKRSSSFFPTPLRARFFAYFFLKKV